MVQPLRGNVFLFNTSPVNSYLIIDEKVIAVDVSTPTVAREMLKFLEKNPRGISRKIDLITATRFHWDHIAGSELLASLSQAKLAFHSYVEHYLTHRQQIQFPPLRKWIKGIFALRHHREVVHLPSFNDLMYSPLAGFPFAPNTLNVSVDFWLEDGQLLPGTTQWQVISTPGHVEDALCLYHRERQIMLTGDTIVNLKGSGELNPFHNDATSLFNSFHRLKACPVEALYPGHGIPLRGDHLWEEIILCK